MIEKTCLECNLNNGWISHIRYVLLGTWIHFTAVVWGWAHNSSWGLCFYASVNGEPCWQHRQETQQGHFHALIFSSLAPEKTLQGFFFLSFALWPEHLHEIIFICIQRCPCKAERLALALMPDLWVDIGEGLYESTERFVLLFSTCKLSAPFQPCINFTFGRVCF